MTVNVVVVDDSGAFREAVRAVVEATAGFEVAGEAATADEALRLVERVRPDVVLLDDQLAAGSGVEAAARIAALGLPTLVVLMTAGDAGPLRHRARGAGAGVVVEKHLLRPGLLRELWAARREQGP